MSEKRIGIKAGLALHSDALRYIEVREFTDRFRIQRAVTVPLVARTIVKNSVYNFDMLSLACKRLRQEIRSFKAPVAVGIPTLDAQLKLIRMPNMNEEDARSALGVSFRDYFTVSADEMSYEIHALDAPSEYTSEGERQFLAVAVQSDYIAKFQTALRRARVPTAAIEPMGTALGRMIGDAVGKNEIYIFVNVEADFLSAVVMYGDNGLLYRFTSCDEDERSKLENLKYFIQSTVSFLALEYQGIRVSKILLSGTTGSFDVLTAAAREAGGVDAEFVNLDKLWTFDGRRKPEPGYETAFALAVR